MPTAETLRALLAQVEEAKAGSRELDIETAKVFGWELNRLHHYWRAPRDWKPLSTIEGVPNFTTSIDAALALVAKVLPGQEFTLYSNGTGWAPGEPTARIRFEPLTSVEEAAATLPLAILAALLRALLQQSGAASAARSFVEKSVKEAGQ